MTRKREMQKDLLQKLFFSLNFLLTLPSIFSQDIQFNFCSSGCSTHT